MIGNYTNLMDFYLLKNLIKGANPMPEISLNTDIIFTIETHCILCGDQLEANITVDHNSQIVSIAIDPSHECLTTQIEETNQDFNKYQNINIKKG